ncbi:MAG TPA: hypothetical protein HPP76_12065 [Desulfuromonadales bacterium]|nr:hypothetical protein [Desulfuromonadales bacterium]
MHDVINEISKIEVPEEIVSHLDVQGMLHDLRVNFKRIDEFRGNRQKQEKKGLGRKLLEFARGDNSLDDAHLGALVAHASFSKAIGELLALSIMLSQKLEQQQSEVASQQDTLSKHTASIGQHTQSLFEQQKNLEHQNLELEEMVNDLIKIKGLTQEEANELIAIANEVKSIRAELGDFVLSSLAESLGEIKATKEEILSALEGNRTFVDTSITNALNEASEKLREQDGRVDGAIHSALEQVSTLHAELLGIHANTDDKMRVLSEGVTSLQSRQQSDNENVWQRLIGLAERADLQNSSLDGHSQALDELKAGVQSGRESGEHLSNRVDELFCAAQQDLAQAQTAAEERFGQISESIGSLQSRQQSDNENVWQKLNSHAEQADALSANLDAQSLAIAGLNTGLQDDREISSGIAARLDEHVARLDAELDRSKKDTESGLGKLTTEIASLQNRHTRDVERLEQTLRAHDETIKGQQELISKQDRELGDLTVGLRDARDFSAALSTRLDEQLQQFAEFKEQSAKTIRTIHLLLTGSLAFSVGFLGYILFR